LQKDTCTNWT